MGRVMKKVTLFGFLLAAVVLSGCFSIPGYVHEDGSITPSYAKEIVIEAVKGSISISPMETSRGFSNVNPLKSDPVRSQKQKMIFLVEGKEYYYDLEGNHNVIFSIRTLSEEAEFRITYKDEEIVYTIHSSDLMDKVIYIENY